MLKYPKVHCHPAPFLYFMKKSHILWTMQITLMYLFVITPSCNSSESLQRKKKKKQCTRFDVIYSSILLSSAN